MPYSRSFKNCNYSAGAQSDGAKYRKDSVTLNQTRIQHLRAWCDYSAEKSKCYFWQTRGGAEVDFIVYGENHFYALEVKNSKSVYSTDLRSLKTFHEDYPESTPFILYRGKNKLLIDDILCFPVEEFLLQLYP